jgi:hypothetical protein
MRVIYTRFKKINCDDLIRTGWTQNPVSWQWEILDYPDYVFDSSGFRFFNNSRLVSSGGYTPEEMIQSSNFSDAFKEHILYNLDVFLPEKE